jgi:hypothetical protein
MKMMHYGMAVGYNIGSLNLFNQKTLALAGVVNKP